MILVDNSFLKLKYRYELEINVKVIKYYKKKIYNLFDKISF